MNPQRESVFATPAWLRDLGFASWLLVGFVLIIVGVIWLLDQTSTIVLPVILACVLGAVTAPLVDRLNRHGLPRGAGAGLVLLGLVAIAGLVIFLVVHGISANSADVSGEASKGLDKIDDAFKDAGISTQDVKADVKKAVPEIREALVTGVAAGIDGLTSLLFFLSFSALATFFVLKDTPVMTRFVTRHMGLPLPVASIVVREIASGLRNYFTGVTIIAAFNAGVVGVGALILGVPLAGTIAVVTFVTAYVPYIGAWTAGIFAFMVALGSQGPTDAAIIAVIFFLANGLLQNLLQPFVFGATLSLNPLAVLIVTVGGGALFGMVGLTLAAPLTSAAVHISEALRERQDPEPGTAGWDDAGDDRRTERRGPPRPDPVGS